MKQMLMSLILLAAVLSMPAATAYDITDAFTIPDYTLPVELSSFTAVFTVDYHVKVSWTSQSESNLLGYFVYRSETNDLAAASQVSGLIEAHNTSTAQSYIFVDTEFTNNVLYYYWINGYEMDGVSNYQGPVSVLTNSHPNITPPSTLQTGIQSVYPNPFNPQATIAYGIKSAGQVDFEFYNLKGQKIKTMQQNHREPGLYSFVFDGVDAENRELSSGVYYVIMKTGSHTSSRKLILMK